MTSKSKSVGKEREKGKEKVGKLKLNRESVRDLTPSNQNEIQGGGTTPTNVCTRTEAGCGRQL
jgi:hypothetical protein